MITELHTSGLKEIPAHPPQLNVRSMFLKFWNKAQSMFFAGGLPCNQQDLSHRF
jgi:hypothetical protein